MLNYDECCLWGNPNVTICRSTSHSKQSLLLVSTSLCLLTDYPDWPPTCISFSKLGDIDIRSYLKRKQVISKIEEDKLIVNERILLLIDYVQKIFSLTILWPFVLNIEAHMELTGTILNLRAIIVIMNQNTTTLLLIVAGLI